MAPELLCLAVALFFEARGEPIDGKELVANVIINRMHHPSYPDTICGVVNQPKQFSYTHELPASGMSDNPLDYNTYHDRVAWKDCVVIAKDILDNGVFNEYVIMYHSKSVSPYWTSSYEVSGMVGNHIFYRESD